MGGHSRLGDRLLIPEVGWLSNKDIGERLFIGERTVKTHVSHLLGKLQLEDRTQLAIYAVRNKLT